MYTFNFKCPELEKLRSLLHSAQAEKAGCMAAVMLLGADPQNGCSGNRALISGCIELMKDLKDVSLTDQEEFFAGILRVLSRAADGA